MIEVYSDGHIASYLFSEKLLTIGVLYVLEVHFGCELRNLF